MINMLRFELRRLLKKPSFYICLGLCVVFTILVIVSTKMTFDSRMEYYKDEFGYTKYIQSMKKQFANQFSPEMISLGGFSTILPIVLAVFTGIFVCEDKVRGTIKNIYARGYSRTNVFFAKFLVSTAVAFALYVLITLTAYLSGAVIFATSNMGVEMVHVKGYILLILGNLMAVLAINALYFMLSELIGNTGFSIAANLFTPGIVNTAMYVLLGVIFTIIANSRNLPDASYHYYSQIETIIEYWIYSLVYSGFSVEMEVADYIGHLIASVGYLGVFGALSWLIVHKKQVKN